MIEPTTSYTHYNAVSDGNQINVIDNRSDRIKDFGSDFTGNIFMNKVRKQQTADQRVGYTRRRVCVVVSCVVDGIPRLMGSDVISCLIIIIDHEIEPYNNNT